MVDVGLILSPLMLLNGLVGFVGVVAFTTEFLAPGASRREAGFVVILTALMSLSYVTLVPILVRFMFGWLGDLAAVVVFLVPLLVWGGAEGYAFVAKGPKPAGESRKWGRLLTFSARLAPGGMLMLSCLVHVGVE